MNNRTLVYCFILMMFLIFCFSANSFAQKTKTKKSGDETEIVKTGEGEKGLKLSLHFYAGESHNHPLIAVWIEDMQENFIKTLYASQSIATGFFGHGEVKQGKWKNEPGKVERPASLPYWLHKRVGEEKSGRLLPSNNNPVPDAYTGATPVSDFTLKTMTGEITDDKFRVLVEINQPWDFNEYWTSNKFPDDFHYKTSCQPSLVYAVTVDTNSPAEAYHLNPIGHGHYSGQDGRLYTDLTTFTTALDIAEKIIVKVIK